MPGVDKLPPMTLPVVVIVPVVPMLPILALPEILNEINVPTDVTLG